MIYHQLWYRAISAQKTRKQFGDFIGKHWFQIILLLLALYLFLNKDVNIQVNVSNNGGLFAKKSACLETKPIVLESSFLQSGSAKPVSFENQNIAVAKDAVPANASSNGRINPPWKSADFKNLSFILNPGLAAAKGVEDAIVEGKLEKCRKYVERFAVLSISEMKKFGVPASITLAQGLLESNAGDSKLANESNNHFGIKCRSKCRGCTCRNYSDDDDYDMFRVFDTAWASFREHSKLLGSPRYKHLKKLGVKNYKAWALGLKKAGYATDKRYPEKLIRIIEALDLYQFDG